MEANSYLKADFLDIVFEGKNKAYGAYMLRRNYDQRLTRAMVATVGLLLILVGIITVLKYAKANAPAVIKEDSSNVVLQRVDVEPDLPPPPSPPPAPDLPKLQTQIAYTPPQIVKDNLVRPKEGPPDLRKLTTAVIGTVDKAGVPAGVGLLVDHSGDGVTRSLESDAEHIFIGVEQMPYFPGGNAALIRFLSTHIQYPPIAQQHGIQGTVVIRFIVNTDGSIVQVEPVGKKIGGGLEAEAMRVVKSMPNWIPGKQNGRAVRVQFDLPIKFKLH